MESTVSWEISIETPFNMIKQGLFQAGHSFGLSIQKAEVGGTLPIPG